MGSWLFFNFFPPLNTYFIIALHTKTFFIIQYILHIMFCSRPTPHNAYILKYRPPCKTALFKELDGAADTFTFDILPLTLSIKHPTQTFSYFIYFHIFQTSRNFQLAAFGWRSRLWCVGSTSNQLAYKVSTTRKNSWKWPGILKNSWKWQFKKIRKNTITIFFPAQCAPSSSWWVHAPKKPKRLHHNNNFFRSIGRPFSSWQLPTTC